MKKYLSILVLAALASCGGRGQKKAAAVDSGQPAAAISQTVAETDKSDETPGTYRGYEVAAESLASVWILKDSLPHLTARDSIYRSSIRPNEELLIGKTYADTFEYLDYYDNADEMTIHLIKGGKVYVFIANRLYGVVVENPQFKTGDIVRIDWETDFWEPAGDDTILQVEMLAKKIEKAAEE